MLQEITGQEHSLWNIDETIRREQIFHAYSEVDFFLDSSHILPHVSMVKYRINVEKSNPVLFVDPQFNSIGESGINMIDACPSTRLRCYTPQMLHFSEIHWQNMLRILWRWGSVYNSICGIKERNYSVGKIQMISYSDLHKDFPWMMLKEHDANHTSWNISCIRQTQLWTVIFQTVAISLTLWSFLHLYRI